MHHCKWLIHAVSSSLTKLIKLLGFSHYPGESIPVVAPLGPLVPSDIVCSLLIKTPYFNRNQNFLIIFLASLLVFQRSLHFKGVASTTWTATCSSYWQAVAITLETETKASVQEFKVEPVGSEAHLECYGQVKLYQRLATQLSYSVLTFRFLRFTR